MSARRQQGETRTKDGREDAEGTTMLTRPQAATPGPGDLAALPRGTSPAAKG